MAKLTQQKATEEYLLCANSVTYFIEKYCYIKDENKGTAMEFHPFPYQVDLLHEWQTHRLCIDLKARQLGISWLVMAFATWLCLFHDNITILCISKSEAKAWDLINKVKFMYDRLPKFLRKEVVRRNQGSLIFAGDETEEGSRIMALPSTPGAAVGYTATLVVVDEWGEQDYAEELYSAFKPTIDMGGRMIGIGTGNAVGSFYHEMCQQAIKGENGFHFRFLSWSLRPGRDGDWYQTTKKSYPSEAEFYRQYPSNEVEAFLSAGGCPFSLEDLEWYLETHVQDPIKPKKLLSDETRGKLGIDDVVASFIDNGMLQIWEKPQLGFPYLVTMDPAGNTGEGDNHAIHVIKTSNMEQVAEFQSKCDMDIATHVAWQLARIYFECQIVWESTGVGQGITNMLVRTDYPHLYQYTGIEAERAQRRSRKVSEPKTPKLGWPATRANNAVRDNDLIAAIRQHSLVIHSKRFFDEAKGFVRQPDGTYGATGRAHDDLVTSLGMGYHIALRLSQAPRRASRIMKVNTRRHFRHKWN